MNTVMIVAFVCNLATLLLGVIGFQLHLLLGAAVWGLGGWLTFYLGEVSGTAMTARLVAKAYEMGVKDGKQNP